MVTVTVEGTRAGPVHGLVTTLKRKLEVGTTRVREQSLESIGLERVAVLVAGWLVGSVLSYVTIANAADFGFSIFDALFLAIWIGTIVFATIFFFRRDRLEPPALELVPRAEEDAPPQKKEGGDGPVLGARDWLQDHPIVSILGVLALGVAGNLIANALS